MSNNICFNILVEGFIKILESLQLASSDKNLIIEMFIRDFIDIKLNKIELIMKLIKEN